MNIEFHPQDNPNLAPRQEVRIENVTASPYPDRRRVKVELKVTPFRERPNLQILIFDSAGKRIATASAIAVMSFAATFTLHLRGLDDPAGDYTVQARLFYEDANNPQHTAETQLRISPETGA